MENVEVPQKTKNRVALRSSNPIPGHALRQSYNSKRYMHPYVYYLHSEQNTSTVYKSQDL